jgi:hypothetical protein
MTVQVVVYIPSPVFRSQFSLLLSSQFGLFFPALMIPAVASVGRHEQQSRLPSPDFGSRPLIRGTAAGVASISDQKKGKECIQQTVINNEKLIESIFCMTP